MGGGGVCEKAAWKDQSAESEKLANSEHIINYSITTAAIYTKLHSFREEQILNCQERTCRFIRYHNCNNSKVSLSLFHTIEIRTITTPVTSLPKSFISHHIKNLILNKIDILVCKTIVISSYVVRESDGHRWFNKMIPHFLNEIHTASRTTF